MHSFNVYVFLVVSCVAPILAATLPGDSDWTFGARVFLKTYTQCQKDEASLIPCLKQRALTVLERAASLDHIPLVDGITIERDPSAVPMDSTLLAEGRSDQLDDKLMKRAISFLQTHTLRFDSPETEVEEGRGKDKNKFGDKLKKKLLIPMMLAVLLGGKIGALVLGGLALLAGKAFIISKLALIVSLFLTVRKLLGSGNSQHETYEIVSKHPVSHHEGTATNHVASFSEPNTGYYGHHRSLHLTNPESGYHNPAEVYAHSKAYSGYLAATESSTDVKNKSS